MRAVNQLGFYFMATAFLISCAGADADIEKARYKVERGGVANGVAAAQSLQSMVDNIGSLDIDTALEVAQIYIGAKIAAAGFDSIDVITNLVYEDEGADTLETLANVVSTTASLEEIRDLLNDVDAMMTSLVARTELDFDPSNPTECTAQASLCDKFREVRLVYGFRWLMDALAISTKETTFFDDSFDEASCVTALESNPNSLPMTLLQARLQMNAAGLDDDQAESLGDPTAIVSGIEDGDNVDTGVDPSSLSSASDLNSLVNLVNKYQNVSQGSLSIDPDFNGVLGDAADGRPDNAKITDLCDYLADQAS